MKLFKKYSILLFSICLLTYSSCNKKEEVTFSKDIAPIIHKNCMPCHRPGEAGPFPLITYNDVKKRAKMIGFVTSTRYMPPWPADANYRHFANERLLTDEEINLITEWIKTGSLIGDSSKIPAAPIFLTGSELGKPDLVVKMKDAFRVKGNNKDTFLVMKLPYEIEHDTFVRAIEFIPGNRKILHHMNAHLLQYDPDKKKNVFDGKSAVSSEDHDSPEYHKLLGLPNDDGTYPMMIPSVSNYLPGVTTALYPEGIGGYRLSKKGAFYLNNMHYGPTPVEQEDQSYFNVFFAKEAPKRPTREVILGTLGVSPIVPSLIIQPNEVKKFRTELRIAKDISLLTLNPHMHLLGKSFLAYALSPSRDTIPLIRINKWDFRWQYFYTFKNILKIPAGSLIVAEGIYDNTVNNPNNPHHPPQVVMERKGSMRTTDEMFQLIVTYLPYQPGDENISLENTSIKK